MVRCFRCALLCRTRAATLTACSSSSRSAKESMLVSMSATSRRTSRSCVDCTSRRLARSNGGRCTWREAARDSADLAKCCRSANAACRCRDATRAACHVKASTSACHDIIMSQGVPRCWRIDGGLINYNSKNLCKPEQNKNTQFAR